MATHFRDFVLLNKEGLIDLCRTRKPKYARYFYLIVLAKQAKIIVDRRIRLNKQAKIIDGRREKNETRTLNNPFVLILYEGSREKALKHKTFGPLFKKYLAEISRIGHLYGPN